MTHTRKIIAGQQVFEAHRDRKIALLGDRETYPSEALCRFQQAESKYGIVEAEIVKSNYGYSVRYASGLNNFAIIAGCRNGTLDGTLKTALKFATAWQAADADRRYVTMSVEG